MWFPPVPGNDLVLTLDKDLQELAERILVEQLAEVRAAGKYTDTYCGVVIVLDPKTGGILAMASIPGYDPNRLSDAGRGEHITLNCPGISTGHYLTGLSKAYTRRDLPFKPIVSIAALEEGKTTVGEVFYADDICPFGLKRCWTLRNSPPLPAHGNVTVRSALAESCNDYFLGNEPAPRYRVSGRVCPEGRLQLSHRTGHVSF